MLARADIAARIQRWLRNVRLVVIAQSPAPHSRVAVAARHASAAARFPGSAYLPGNVSPVRLRAFALVVTRRTTPAPTQHAQVECVRVRRPALARRSSCSSGNSPALRCATPARWHNVQPLPDCRCARRVQSRDVKSPAPATTVPQRLPRRFASRARRIHPACPAPRRVAVASPPRPC